MMIKVKMFKKIIYNLIFVVIFLAAVMQLLLHHHGQNIPRQIEPRGNVLIKPSNLLSNESGYFDKTHDIQIISSRIVVSAIEDISNVIEYRWKRISVHWFLVMHESDNDSLKMALSKLILSLKPLPSIPTPVPLFTFTPKPALTLLGLLSTYETTISQKVLRATQTVDNTLYSILNSVDDWLQSVISGNEINYQYSQLYRVCILARDGYVSNLQSCLLILVFRPILYTTGYLATSFGHPIDLENTQKLKDKIKPLSILESINHDVSICCNVSKLSSWPPSDHARINISKHRHWIWMFSWSWLMAIETLLIFSSGCLGRLLNNVIKVNGIASVIRTDESIGSYSAKLIQYSSWHLPLIFVPFALPTLIVIVLVVLIIDPVLHVCLARSSNIRVVARKHKVDLRDKLLEGWSNCVRYKDFDDSLLATFLVLLNPVSHLLGVLAMTIVTGGNLYSSLVTV